jgi:hypothetical protein
MTQAMADPVIGSQVLLLPHFIVAARLGIGMIGYARWWLNSAGATLIFTLTPIAVKFKKGTVWKAFVVWLRPRRSH